MKPTLSKPLRLAAIYVAFSSAWILLSDRLIDSLGLSAHTSSQLQTWKGLFFVLISSLLIYLISRTDQQALQQLLGNLQRRTRQLLQAQREAGLGNWEFDGRFHWNEAALKLLDRPAHDSDCSLEEFLGWLHPAERRAAEQGLQVLLDGSGALALNARLNRPLGQPTVWLALRGEPQSGGHASGTLMNISAQKRDEEALRESEQRFRQLFEQTPRIAVQGYDRERRVIYWNQASALLYGYSQQQALGRRIEELIIPDELRQQVIADINRWMIGGAPIPAAELTLRRRDGRPVTVYSSHLMLQNTRNQLELYCVDIDLSEQQAARQALQTSETRYRQLVEQLNDVIFLCDSEGRLTFLNLAWWSISGHSPQDSLGQPLPHFLHEADATELTERCRELLAGTRQRWTAEYRLRGANGKLRWVELQLAQNDDGQPGLRGSLGDIHGKHQVQELQEARNAVLDDLLAQRPLRQILDGIARRLEALGQQMRVSIMLLDADACLRVHAAPSLPAHYSAAIDGLHSGPGMGSCGSAAHSGELVIAEDVQQDPSWQDYRDLARSADIQACWSLPFKDDADQVLGTFGIYYAQAGRPSTDDIALVTDFSRLAGLAVQQQRGAQAQQESEQRFRATFEQAAIGIAHVAPDGHWLRVNPLLCSMLGYSQDELLGMTFQQLTHAEDLEEDLQLTRQLLAGERDHLSMEKRYLRRDGSLLWAHLSASLVRDEQGQPKYFISMLEDIGMRKQHEEALRQAATVFAGTREAIVILDARRHIIAVNPACSGMFGFPVEQLIGRRVPLQVPNPEQRERVQELWHTIRQGGAWHGELLGQRADGSYFPMLMHASRVRESETATPQYVLMSSDISQYKADQERLVRMVHFDPLTGLPNRQLSLERLQQALERAQRQESSLAVLFLDLDHFKNINDSLGHPVGDELLQAIARRLQQRLRETDTLARLGGDEFLILLENLQRPEEAAQIAESLLRLFENPFLLADQREAYLGASIGISLYPDDSRNPDELVRNADTAMYQAKAEGRNTFCFYTQALTERARLRLTLEARMRKALKQGEFGLHYQPLVDTFSGTTLGVEALLRWQTATETFHPADFIPLAEDTGLIIPVGAWVLREACRQFQLWRSQGLQLETLAVNLSPRQFHQPDLVAQVQQALFGSGLPAECLELEITEGALMEDVKLAQNTLAALKQLGVRLAVDDFGTGYSSLAYLRRFPLDKLKIDQSFMRDVPQDQGNLEIVSTIIALARSLKLTVLAEGVETAEQLAVLRQLDCEQCQGYLFSRPLPASELFRRLETNRQSAH